MVVAGDPDVFGTGKSTSIGQTSQRIWFRHRRIFRTPKSLQMFTELTLADLIEDVVANVEHLHTASPECDVICQHRHHVVAQVHFSQFVWHPGRTGKGAASDEGYLVVTQVHLTDRHTHLMTDELQGVSHEN